MHCINGMDGKGMKWNPMQWNGIQCNEIKCNEMKFNAMEWNPMQWKGFEPFTPMQFSFGKISNAINVAVVAEFDSECLKPQLDLVPLATFSNWKIFLISIKINVQCKFNKLDIFFNSLSSWLLRHHRFWIVALELISPFSNEGKNYYSKEIYCVFFVREEQNVVRLLLRYFSNWST